MQSLNLKINGLYSYPNDLSAVPQGALAQADNIWVDRDSTAEPRRGFGYLAHGGVLSQFSNPAYRANKIFFYQGQSLYHYDTNLLAYHNASTGFVPYSGTYNPPSATVPVRSAAANQNFYFMTDQGIFKLDAYTATPHLIGVPPGLDITATVAVSPAATFLQPATSTAYRIVWGIKDANQNLIFGAPSQRTEITNTTAAAIAVVINSTIPAGITTAHFFQIYRSQAVAAGIEPNDELGLVYEGNPNSTDLSNGFIQITDFTPDSLRGATIYTAQSQEGIAQANAPAPLALDMAVFKNCLFFGNTTGLQNFFLTLLGIGSPNGLQVGDTVVIDGITYTAATTEVPSTGHFQVYPIVLITGVTGTTTSGSPTITSVSPTTGIVAGQLITSLTGIPANTYVVSITGTTITMSQNATGTNSGLTFTGDSAAQAIRDTALSLVRVINRDPSSLVYAYYLSGPTDLPGLISLQARSLDGTIFSITSNNNTAFSPNIGPAAPTTQMSTNDRFKNGLFYSKVNEPEAIPLENVDYVGAADKNILRIIALRDSLFVLKEDGIFRVYGTDPTNFQISPLDYTAILISPESAVVLNNQIYALTTQGVVAISETGVQIMSHAIENDLTSLISENYAALQNTSFGVSYESSRAFYLWCISDAGDAGPTQYYRYNYITNAWTHAFMEKTCGAVNPADDRLYLGNATLPIVDLENKTLTYSDYADYSSTQTISAVSGMTVTISGTDTIEIGSIIFQSATVFGQVASVNTVAGTVTTTLPTSLVAGSADVLSPISTAIEWVPVTFANPGMSKQVREASVLFLTDFNGTALVGFSSDVSPNFEYESVIGDNVGGWGLFGWGGPAETPTGVTWGGSAKRGPKRISVPRNQQRSSLLSVSFQHSFAYSPWAIQGISLIGNNISERISQ